MASQSPRRTARPADQADGLRRLMRAPGVRVLPVFGSRERTAAAINLAAAAAAEGHRVVVLDAARGEIAAALGLAARYELKHLLDGEKRFDEVVVRTPAGLRLIPAARGFQMLADARLKSCARAGNDGDSLFAAFARLSEPADLVVLHAADTLAAAALPSAPGEALIVLGAANEAVTEAYAQMKTLAQRFGLRRFRTLVLHQDAAEAARMQATFAKVAAQKLGVEVLAGAAIARDLAMREAERARRSVIDTDPSGAASRAFRLVAGGLAAWSLAEVHDAAALGASH